MNVQVAVTTSGHLLGLGAPGTVPGTTSTPGTIAGWASNSSAVRSSPTSATSAPKAPPPAPDARPAGGRLTDRQKTAISLLNGIRAVVEQTIAHVKNSKVLKHYRGPLDNSEPTLRCVEVLFHL